MTEREALHQEILQLCRRPALKSINEVMADREARFGSAEAAQAAVVSGQSSICELNNIDELMEWLEERHGSTQKAIQAVKEGRIVLLNEHKRTWLEEAFK